MVGTGKLARWEGLQPQWNNSVGRVNTCSGMVYTSGKVNTMGYFTQWEGLHREEVMVRFDGIVLSHVDPVLYKDKFKKKKTASVCGFTNTRMFLSKKS
jgi:hypothetical protein